MYYYHNDEIMFSVWKCSLQNVILTIQLKQDGLQIGATSQREILKGLVQCQDQHCPITGRKGGVRGGGLFSIENLSMSTDMKVGNKNSQIFSSPRPGVLVLKSRSQSFFFIDQVIMYTDIWRLSPGQLIRLGVWACGVIHLILRHFSTRERGSARERGRGEGEKQGWMWVIF